MALFLFVFVTLARTRGFVTRPTALSTFRPEAIFNVKEESEFSTMTSSPDKAPSASTSLVTKTETETPTSYGRLLRKIFLTQYEPHPDEGAPFFSRLESQTAGGVTAKVSVLTAAESRQYFGVPLARRGLQAVYVEIDNSAGDSDVFLDRVRIDPNYFSPTEAAARCRLASLRILAEVGFLSGLLFLPLVLLLPLKMGTAGPANRRMEEFFQGEAFPLGICQAGQSQRGFFYTSIDNGTKNVLVDLIGAKRTREFAFNVKLSDLAVDFQKGDALAETEKSAEAKPCASLQELQDYLTSVPRAVTNKKGTREGDPMNLVIIGDFETVLATFTGARWDETEIINIATCTRMAKSFLLGSEYRYAPVSALYVDGRPQDLALQRARATINERLHLRLWWTPRTWQGKPVWVGQVSRDIGVKLAKTWNLTTHRIDPNVDEARDYVLAALLQTGHLDQVGYVAGVGESKASSPRCNLGGDPYVTDGKRAVLVLSESKTETKLLEW